MRLWGIECVAPNLELPVASTEVPQVFDLQILHALKFSNANDKYVKASIAQGMHPRASCSFAVVGSPFSMCSVTAWNHGFRTRACRIALALALPVDMPWDPHCRPKLMLPAF